MARVPKYQHHRASGQARVTLHGKDHYLGPHGSADSKSRYRDLIDRWKLEQKAGTTAALTVGELVLIYDTHVRTYYVKNGKPTSEVALIQSALKPLVKSFTHALITDFGPLALKRLQKDMIALGWTRKTVNQHLQRVRRLFSWGVSEQHVPPEVLTALRTVTGLRKGRSAAREGDGVRPVPVEAVNAVLPHVSAQVSAMIRLQLLTGARPGEVTKIRPCDVDRDGDVWTFTPASHKTEHHEQSRVIFIGPRAQVILAPFLDDRPADAFCFGRKGFDVRDYRDAVHDGCRRAEAATWSPNQLRHTRATELRKQFGIDTASTILGHANLPTTAVYAERDAEKARQVMAEVG